MRRIFALILMVSSASGALAENNAPYNMAEQTYQPVPMAAPTAPAMNEFAGQPVYAPQPAYPQAAPAPAPAARAPQPGEYGQSVMTDIRQMNF